jgi:hypothetical protein
VLAILRVESGDEACIQIKLCVYTSKIGVYTQVKLVCILLVKLMCILVNWCVGLASPLRIGFGRVQPNLQVLSFVLSHHFLKVIPPSTISTRSEHAWLQRIPRRVPYPAGQLEGAKWRSDYHGPIVLGMIQQRNAMVNTGARNRRTVVWSAEQGPICWYFVCIQSIFRPLILHFSALTFFGDGAL